jgi:hypothetical protein
MVKKEVSIVVFTVSLFAVCTASAQTTSATCNFDDGQQIAVRYQPASADNVKLESGKVWSPGGSPMFFFTSAPLKIGKSTVPIGAYSMYVIPGKERWTLVLNKNVSENAAYDQAQDLLREPMDLGTLPQPADTASVYFGHVAPKQCNMRLYYGKTGAWTDFYEQ